MANTQFTVPPPDLDIIFESSPRGSVYYPITAGELLKMDGGYLLLMDGGKVLLNLAAATVSYPIMLVASAPDLSIVFEKE